MKSLFYRKLGAAQQKYDEIYACVRAHEDSFPVEDAERDAKILSHVLADHPELFYTNTSMTVRGTVHRMEAFINYTYSDEEALRVARRLDRVAEDIVDDLIDDNDTDYDKVLALHDYLKNTVEYDKRAAAAVAEDATSPAIGDAYSAVGAILKHKCVCEGFAEAFKLLCDKVGVECWVVMGTGSSSVGRGPHAWNIVRINGHYHHVDVTWDNQYASSSKIPNYAYFNLSDEEMEVDHTWDHSLYPACPHSPYNYFNVNNSLISTKPQLEGFLYTCFLNEEAHAIFRVMSGTRLAAQIESRLSEIVGNAARGCRYPRVRGYSVSWVPEKLIYCLTPSYEV